MATRWGICSAGMIASDFVTCLSKLPANEHQVVAIAARDDDRARKLSTLTGTKTVYGSYDDLAKDPNADIVYIGTVNAHHFNACKLFLESGKHVLCEKPLAMNYKQASELVSLANERKLFFMEAVWTRCFPVYHKLNELLLSGAIGDIWAISATIGANFASVPRYSDKAQGCGSVLDLGVYAVNFANFIFKEAPTEIRASGHFYDSGVDKCACISLKYTNNGMAQLMSNTACNTDISANIYGSKGTLRIPEWFYSPDKLILADGSTQQFPYPDLGDAFFNYPNGQGMTYEAQHVRECLQKGLLESPLMPQKDTLQVMRIMDEVRKQLGVHYDADD